MDKQELWYSQEIPLRDQIVADVGANVGRLSQFFWDAGKGSNTVISIEPLRQNIKRIKTRINRVKANNWIIEACAVSDRAGEIRLRRFHSRETGWNSVVAMDGTNDQEVVVPAKRLPDIAPTATVVKVDIEGHEYAVIDQAIGLLEQAHTWAVELHMIADRPLGRVIEQFMDYGYSVLAAAQTPGHARGAWSSVQITPQLQWAQIPVAKRLSNGDVFKMLHIIAKRDL